MASIELCWGGAFNTEGTETQRTHRTMKETEKTMITRGESDPLTQRIIGCAVEVHRMLGPGLLESAYEQCMAHEMALQDIPFRLQVPTPVAYKGLRSDCAYKADIIVRERVMVELKSVETVTALHHAQLLTCMKVSRAEIGLLINFNVPRLIDGVKRFRI
jgi:GxxExxY protein